MQEIINNLQIALTNGVPRFLGAIGVILLGLLVALLLRSLSNALFDRVNLDERLERRMGGTPSGFSIKKIVGQVIFWLVMLFAIISALDILTLTAVAEPFDNVFDQILGYIPNLLAAAALALLAWIVANLVSRIIKQLMDSSNVDERLARNAQMEQRVPLSQSVSTLAYWLIWFLFLPAILSTLALEGVLDPVEGLLNDVLAFLPNLFSAALILVVGYFVARIVRDIVTNLLASTGLDALGERLGFGSNVAVPTSVATTDPAVDGRLRAGSMSLSQLLGLVVYVLILIPVAIAALDALNLEAISEPAIEMLQTVLNTIPALFAAVILLVLAYFVARLVQDLVTRLLAGMGLDRFLTELGVTRVIPDGRSPSEIAGLLVMVVIMLFAATEAAELLGFEAVAVIIANFLAFLGNIILGLIVLALGLYIANLVDSMIRSSGIQNSDTLATIGRYAVILLALTMALRQMGIAEDIITLAFGLMLGAVALAAAIAFGWGGREVAQRQLRKVESQFERGTTTPPTTPPPPPTTTTTD